MAGPGQQPMIGRRDELDRLRRLLPLHGPRVGLVGGDAGIGKTLLLSALAERLRADGLGVLRGYATPASAARPFDLLRSLVAIEVATWDDVPPALAGRRAAVVRLVGPVAPQLTAAEEPAADELAWVGSELLAHLARHPTALVVDDLHLADAESLDALDRLLAGSAPVLLAAAYRSDGLDASAPARDWLTRIERRQPVEHVRLPPFDLAETRTLLSDRRGGPPPEPVVRRLRERTGGNPFFLVELLEANATRPLDELATGALPATVAVLLEDQVCCLAPGPRHTLDRLAVLGQRVSIDELLAVSDRDEPDVLGDLRQLMEAGLVAEDRPDQLTFRHALVREAVLGRVLTREQRLVHQRALDWVLATSGDESMVVHHAVAAGRDELVVDAARRAAPAALDAGSPRRALALAEAGLERVPGDAGLLTAAGRACWQLGLRREAKDHAEALLARAGGADGDRAAEAAALGLLIRLAWEAGDETGRRRLAERLEALVPDLGAHQGRAQALTDLAQTAMLTDRATTAIAWADEALALAGERGERRVAVQARVEKASACLTLDPEDAGACEALLAAIDEAERLGDVLTLLRAISNLVHMAVDLTTDREDALLRRGFAAAGRLADAGVADLVVSAMVLRAPLRDGDGAAVRAEVDKLATRQDEAVEEFLGWLVLEVGGPDELRALADRLAARSDLDDLVVSAAAAVALGDAEREDRAWAGLAQLLDGPGPDPMSRDANLLSVTLLIDRPGRSALVRRLLDALAGARMQVLGERAFLRALAAEAQRDWPGAEVELDRARRWSPREPAPFRAELDLAQARVRMATGDLAGARASAASARRGLDRWPGPRRDRIDRFLDGCDRRTPAGPGRGSLTARELEVAELVAQGLSNGDIAERLFISRKTASVHVSNILAKLGAANRTEIATWVVRRDAVPAGPA